MLTEMSESIAVAAPYHRKALCELFDRVTAHLRASGIDQWDRWYPNRWVIGGDIRSGALWVLEREGRCIGAVVVDAKQNVRYQALPWKDAAGRPACIHRLAVDPQAQGRGLGGQLLRHAEATAQAGGATSIRLDVYTGNAAVIAMYARAGYEAIGEIRYPLRKHAYLGMEKIF